MENVSINIKLDVAPVPDTTQSQSQLNGTVIEMWSLLTDTGVVYVYNVM